MNAGRLDKRPVFQTATITQDANSGAEVFTWPPLGGTTLTEWADFQYLGSREFPMRDKLYEQTTARVIVRYATATAAIQPATHRVIHDSKTWDVTGVIPDSKKTQIIIELTEIV